jgi:alginate O-acetyltransferase complex protein AlgI
MVFNSIVFLVFLTLVLSLYYRLGHRGQNWLLLGASYIFYGWWNWRFVSLLLFSTFFDYYCALWIHGEPRPRRRRMFLAFSMAINLGVLCIFKYYNFFAESLQSSLALFDVSVSFPTLYVILPVGISFYTFLSMSYTIDVYRAEMEPTRNPTDFMLYVAFFPHLVAGPIVRASFLLPQCQRPRVVIPREVANGIWLILLGYVKKVVIADRLAQVADWGFATPTPPFADANSWLVLYAFAIQIYGDFSGYSDIARGLSKLMGFELVENFRAPYLVTNPSEFWRNWHISLSTWLRDYLYVPLGGNRNGSLNTYRNLMSTMLLGGLWHGAGAAYVVWGLYHGLLLSVHRWWSEWRAPKTDAPAASVATAGVRAVFLSPGIKRLVAVFLFFHITCIGWLLFRAGSVPRGFDQLQLVRDYLAAMFTWPQSASPLFHGVILAGIAVIVFQWRYSAMNRFSDWPRWGQALAVIAALASIAALGVFEGAQFIYFQF